VSCFAVIQRDTQNANAHPIAKSTRQTTPEKISSKEGSSLTMCAKA
jgi:hypothetical protein